MKATCKTFRAISWEAAIQDAEVFIGTLEPDQLVSVSHVSESPYAVLFVWFKAVQHATEKTVTTESGMPSRA